MEKTNSATMVKRSESIVKGLGFLCTALSAIFMSFAYVTYKMHTLIGLFFTVFGVILLIIALGILFLSLRDYLISINSKIEGIILIPIFWLVVFAGAWFLIFYEMIGIIPK